MGGTENAVTLITAEGAEEWPRLPKDEVARRLAARIAAALGAGGRAGTPSREGQLRCDDGASAAIPRPARGLGRSRRRALPSYATAGAAGADIRANLPGEERASGFILKPMERRVVPTGLPVEFPKARCRSARGRAWR